MKIHKLIVPMTNADRIRAMSDEELAKYNVYETYECEVDYAYNDESFLNYTLVYKTSDETFFYDEEDAIKHELSWLQKPVCEMDGGSANAAD